ncbi:MAG: TM2 domain-containing protein [Pseudomonadota bacterium]
MINTMIGAYVIWLFFGWCSAHRFFLGRKKMAFRQLGLLVGGVICVVIATWDSGDVTSLRGIREIEFERAIFLMFGVLMLIVWNFWLLIDVVLIALITLEEERKAEIAAGLGTGMTAARKRAAPNRVEDGQEEDEQRSTLSDRYVMPWRQERHVEEEVYRARDD